MKQMADVAIVGGGPAGLQAALVLARTRKKVVVFDLPSPPRNGASHGVHNVLGLDGMLPAEIREQAWRQIDVYQSASLEQVGVQVIESHEEGYVLTTATGKIVAKKVIIAIGFNDHYPDLTGFTEAWADSIIPCPFCDGYENRDKTWGLVADSEMMAGHMPHIAKNWTSELKLILNDPSIKLDTQFKRELEEMGVLVYQGPVTAIHQENGKVEAITLAGGMQVHLETLWWIPQRERTALEIMLIENFDLPLDETGLIQVDENQRSSKDGLYMVGDIVRFSTSALGAIEEGNKAAVDIIKSWY